MGSTDGGVSMMIAVIARCLNEQRNAKVFCSNYSWADAIIISDGGSTDGTLDIVTRFPNTVVTHFQKKEQLGDGHFMNPESDHLNSAIAVALNWGADWIVYDDMDSFPNWLLYPKARDYFRIAEQQGKTEVFARRYYMWGYKEYLPKLSSDNPPVDSVNPMHSIWGWHKTAPIHGSKPGQKFIEIGGINPNIDAKLFIPDNECLVHYSWPTPQVVEEKMRRYASWGSPQNHPLDAFGPAEKAPAYMMPVFRYDDDV